MRLPWVARAAYDALDAHHLATIATWRKQHETACDELRHEQDQRNILTVLIDEARREVQAARQQVERERNIADIRYDALLDKYHALRTAGANPAQNIVALPKAEPDPVTQAVITMSKGNRSLYKHYAEYVAVERAKGTADEDIAKAVLTGVEDDMGVPAT